MISFLISLSLGALVFLAIYVSSIFITYGRVRWYAPDALVSDLKSARLNSFDHAILCFAHPSKGNFASLELGFANYADTNTWYPVFSPGYRAIAARRAELLKEAK